MSDNINIRYDEDENFRFLTADKSSETCQRLITCIQSLDKSLQEFRYCLSRWHYSKYSPYGEIIEDALTTDCHTWIKNSLILIKEFMVSQYYPNEVKVRALRCDGIGQVAFILMLKVSHNDYIMKHVDYDFSINDAYGRFVILENILSSNLHHQYTSYYAQSIGIGIGLL